MSSIKQTPAWFQYPKYTWNKKHAVVIGAGIAGCQAAWHLVKQGWQVTVIEREAKLAQHASGNPAGIISPKMSAQASTGEAFYVDCFDYAIDQLGTLKKRHKDLDWHACGLLQLAHNEREEVRWETLKDRFSGDTNSSFLQLLDEQESSQIAGIPLNYKASYFPKAGWIDPVNFCETLLKDCADQCKLVLETDALKIDKTANKWNVESAQGNNISSAEVIIITSGKDLNQFEQSNQLPSLPVAGQTTVATTNSFASQLKTTIGHEGYLTPSSDKTSQLTFGASFDRSFELNSKNTVDIDKKTDNKNLNQLGKYLPELVDSFTETNSAHAAIRMTTPDRFPYVGGVADNDFYANNYADLHQGKQYKEYKSAEYLEGLFVLGGLGSRGLTTSGRCAKVLSDIITNRMLDENQTIQQQCHPARFIIKDLKRNKYIPS